MSNYTHRARNEVVLGPASIIIKEYTFLGGWYFCVYSFSLPFMLYLFPNLYGVRNLFPTEGSCCTRQTSTLCPQVSNPSPICSRAIMFTMFQHHSSLLKKKLADHFFLPSFFAPECVVVEPGLHAIKKKPNKQIRLPQINPSDFSLVIFFPKENTFVVLNCLEENYLSSVNKFNFWQLFDWWFSFPLCSWT